jgi:hypothetical protein
MTQQMDDHQRQEWINWAQCPNQVLGNILHWGVDDEQL